MRGASGKIRRSEDQIENRMKDCACGHTYRIHSNVDGQCLGPTIKGPMTCLCEIFVDKQRLREYAS
jgi:hypothetical protein